ncbi:hypothetical protein [Nocardia pseudovaccinii]|uniref:hypothetical protein n=1 Tax=Nocardia pseudovaccinii TaxID=189540 RepID=UPI0007A40FA1|nr:hypothetical protein [Nocardia pseudovaccinii]
MTLALLSVRLADHSRVCVTAEQISEHFALTPAVVLRPDGTCGLADSGQLLTHIPSGYPLTYAGWTDLRRFAADLELLPIDWSQFDPVAITDEQHDLIRSLAEQR